jgi:endo-1,4-beta-D-glucanase Y
MNIKKAFNLKFFPLRSLKQMLIVLSVLGLSINACVSSATNKNWPLWEVFKNKFVQADGRVITNGLPNYQSFSEGQSYAMFFALVANDQASFERIWQWTKENLSGNNVNDNLPAWLWGKSEDGSWGVIDKNSASDADLWIAYSLLEAGRKWKKEPYTIDALKMIAKIEAVEVVTIPTIGKLLLPGQIGFEQKDKFLTQFNASYMPLPILRRFASASHNGPWDEIARNTALLISANNPNGYAVDWLSYESKPNADAGFIVDPVKGERGSYDAIRVYLWAGMTSQNDPLATPIMKSLYGMTEATIKNGMPPEVVNVQQGTFSGVSPIGFSAALLPFFKNNDQTDVLSKQLNRVNKAISVSSSQYQTEIAQLPYYDYVLCLFGSGWIEGRFTFSTNGQVNLDWN